MSCPNASMRGTIRDGLLSLLFLAARTHCWATWMMTGAAWQAHMLVALIASTGCCLLHRRRQDEVANNSGRASWLL